MREPLITVALWADFVRATTIPDKEDADAALYQAISELPQPNRDTLAFLVLHLQRVSSSAECKMPISNLAKVFGPTLVGFSSLEPSPTSMLSETKNQVAVCKSNIYIIILQSIKLLTLFVLHFSDCGELIKNSF